MTTTLVSFERELTDAERTLRLKYLLSQMQIGETDGIAINCTRAGLDQVRLMYLQTQNWKTEASANAYVAFCNTFDPPPVFTQVFNFGDPMTWIADLDL